MILTAEEEHARPITRLALRFLALTAVRPSELRGALWDEFEDLNGEEPLWRIPAARMKGTNFAQKFDYQQGASGPVTESGTFVSDGVGVGAGVEQRLGGEISIKTEYRYSSTNGLHRHQAVAGLGIRF